jgi:hypothetical protein
MALGREGSLRLCMRGPNTRRASSRTAAASDERTTRNVSTWPLMRSMSSGTQIQEWSRCAGKPGALTGTVSVISILRPPRRRSRTRRARAGAAMTRSIPWRPASPAIAGSTQSPSSSAAWASARSSTTVSGRSSSAASMASRNAGAVAQHKLPARWITVVCPSVSTITLRLSAPAPARDRGCESGAGTRLVAIDGRSLLMRCSTTEWGATPRRPRSSRAAPSGRAPPTAG